MIFNNKVNVYNLRIMHIQKLVKQIIAIFLILMLALSCNNSKTKTEKRIDQWIGSKLKLPQVENVLYKDSLLNDKFLLKNNAKLKITTVVWGDCDACVNELKEWKIFLENLSNTEEVNVNFYLCTSDLNFFRDNMYSQSIQEIPLIIDSDYYYLDKNVLPYNDKNFQTFLIDSNNKVLLIGNPIFSQKLKKLYLEEIHKRI